MSKSGTPKMAIPNFVFDGEEARVVTEPPPRNNLNSSESSTDGPTESSGDFGKDIKNENSTE